uniref:BTB domain-containing protein n=2 Tax=Panagrolaimus sp. JU765 TaxID=591449 RepID=A0AC34QXW3_9BILA
MIPRVRSHHINAKRLELLKSQMSAAELIKSPMNGDLANNNNTTLEKPTPEKPVEILRINVGGRSARLNADLIQQRLESSRLAHFCAKTHVERLTECDTFFEHSKEYYFERSPIIFEYIVDFYVTGRLHRPMETENMVPHWSLQAMEVCCMIWFTFEYLCRFSVHPRKCDFVKQALNVIDLLTILPFFVEECLPFFGFGEVELKNLRGPMVVMRVMRLARVLRIFKLARYSIGLRAFGETMRKSAAELSMLGMFLLTGIMLFSTAIYFFERDEPNTKFYSIPSACWWCIVTMTTVGYGDLVPVTTGGKVVAAMASVCGIIVLAFPISMIIDKFAESTGEWYGDELVMNLQHHRRNDPRFKSEKRVSSCGGQFYPTLINNGV